MCLKGARPVEIPEAIGYKFMVRGDKDIYESLFSCPVTADEPIYHKGVKYESKNNRGVKRLMSSYVPGFHAYASLEGIKNACDFLVTQVIKVTKAAPTRRGFGLVMVKVKLEEIHTVGTDIESTCYVAKYQTIMEEV